MTNNIKSKEEILAIIREKCPELKELKLGCRFNMKKGTRVIGYVYDSSWYEEDGFIFWRDNEDLYDETWSVEIIGLEPQLNHLIFAIAENGHDFGFATSLRRTNELHVFPQGNSQIKEPTVILGKNIGDMDLRHWTYDLTKSVPENLENEELRALLTNLLK